MIETELDGEDVATFVKRSAGPCIGLPAPRPGVCYIVPSFVLERVRRPDLRSPYRPKRDSMGNVIYCQALRADFD